MTDKEIILALECCEPANTLCEDCPLFYMEGLSCMNTLAREARKLIQRQQEEIKVVKLLEELIVEKK